MSVKDLRVSKMKFKENCVINVSLHRNTKANVMYPFNIFGRIALVKGHMMDVLKFGDSKYHFKQYFHMNFKSRYCMEC